MGCSSSSERRPHQTQPHAPESNIDVAYMRHYYATRNDATTPRSPQTMTLDASRLRTLNQRSAAQSPVAQRRTPPVSPQTMPLRAAHRAKDGDTLHRSPPNRQFGTGGINDFSSAPSSSLTFSGGGLANEVDVRNPLEASTTAIVLEGIAGASVFGPVLVSMAGDQADSMLPRPDVL